ncbi:hypothetical protein BGX34_008356 [Mortierella sp. NVP85]|nr:hypothetical protein BGX34_008356 [Mortierella sp. NVP85]
MAAELLPELRQHITRYLDFETLKVFSLVCKVWYLDAYPILWDRFSCKVPWWCSMTPEEYEVWLEIIRRNASSFKHIYHDECDEPISPRIRDLLLDRCHDLATIDAAVAVTDFQNPYHYWEGTLEPLIEQNRASLRRLGLRVDRDLLMTPLQLPALLARLPHLRSLELGVPGMTVEDLISVLNACQSSLECLELFSNLRRRKKLEQEDSATQPYRSPTTTTATTPLRLRHLRIHYPCFEGTLEDLLSCLEAHSLEELQLDTVFPLRMIPIPSNPLWLLTHLHLQTMDPCPEMVLPEIFNTIQPHHLHYVYLGSVDTGCTAKLIEQQHQSLESLHVTFIQDHTGALADILATCSKLKRLFFSAPPFVDIRTLIDPQKPWVCTGLEVFEGCFGLSPLPVTSPPPSVSDANNDAGYYSQLEDQFMQRLGQLTKLRHLAQQHDFNGDVIDAGLNKNIMTWSLSSGLAHLSNLTNLRKLEFSNRHLPEGMGIPEMMFIKGHWHNLRELKCNYIPNARVRHWPAAEWPELIVTLNWWE